MLPSITALPSRLLFPAGFQQVINKASLGFGLGGYSRLRIATRISSRSSRA